MGTLLASYGPHPAGAQEASATHVTVLLDHSEVESILGGFRGDFERALGDLLATELPAGLSEVMDRVLSVDALRPVMARESAAQGRPDLLAAAAELVVSGALARIDSITEADQPTVDLGEFARGLQADPPAPTRIQLVGRFAAAQAAGDFFVLLDERTREAAYLVAASLTSDAATFVPLSEDEWRERSQQNFLSVLIAFLHRFEPVSDELLEEGITEWTSEEGQWFVEAYSLALGETLLRAAEAISQELRRTQPL